LRVKRAAQTAETAVHFDLNVEVGADGSLRSFAPDNPPAASNPPTN
jgi:hypothetical protein